MNLADRLVALGIAQRGQFPHPDNYALYYLTGRTIGGLPAERFCNSWEVAGAVMERLDGASWHLDIASNKRSVNIQFLDAARGYGVHYENELGSPLVTAIIEAGVKALEKDGRET